MLKKDDVLELYIEDISTSGDGIGHVDGFALFVKDTVIEDKVEVKVIKVKKNYGYARLQKVIQPSKYRVEPICDKARQCGGCQIQHMDYKRQLEFKQDMVKNCLTRIGGLKDIELEPIVGMEEPYYYRNKAQYPVGVDKNGNISIGFYAARTHSIISSEKCYIQDKVNKQIIDIVKKFIIDKKLKPYDEKTRKGLVRHIMTRVGFKTHEIMVCLVVTETLSNTLKKELIKYLQQVENIKSVCLNVNKENTNVILGEKIINLYGEGYITDYIGEVKYRISPLSFYQVNPVQTEKLYKIAMEYANIKKDEVVWDMYCGIGTISLFLASKAKKVYGVEIVPQAIVDAKENAKINKIENVEFFTGAAEEVVPEQYKKGIKADVVVVDPPRKGCDQKLLQTLSDMKPSRIVYVSCDPATLARDIKWLGGNGYKFEKGVPVDQFCHSTHIETVCLLSKISEMLK